MALILAVSLPSFLQYAPGLDPGAKMGVRDITNRKDLPPATGSWGATVDTHDVAFITLTPIKD